MNAPSSPAPVLLSAYAAPEFELQQVELVFRLDAAVTEVWQRLTLRHLAQGGPIRLHGRELERVSLSLDGRVLDAHEFAEDSEGLSLTLPDGEPHRLECVTRIRPQQNHALEGLYLSGGALVTQCEAEGFRRIAYFPDRPDVMTRYTVRLEADPERYPLLLCNGNRVAAGPLPEGGHFAVFEDPWPKPCYLFALVAGRFEALSDRFVTASGRTVELAIHTVPGQSARAAFAMQALKRAMRWDEERFGREYDLDQFHIVAIDDFNAGAMENKGLNIFNARYILGDAETATDEDIAAIESVVAHEYFHNWSGNRVTLRDWFQLSLKEGFTVYRDQEFSADTLSRPVQRLRDVEGLRAYQFAEDAGPLAHPVRPAEYRQINNFYTATVYNKGAEVVRMLATWLGEQAFRAGCDRYFEDNDGRAATVEDFLAALEQASGQDLSAFLRWYNQAGTPRLALSRRLEAGELVVRLEQTLADTPAQPAADKQPQPIPFRLGFLTAEGAPWPLECGAETESEHLLRLDQAAAEWRFRDPSAALTCLPVLSPLRGFSAPVQLEYPEAESERLARWRGDADAFSRFEAGRTLLIDWLMRALAGGPAPLPSEWIEAVAAILGDPELDDLMRAQLLSLPSETQLAELWGARHPGQLDPHALRAALEGLRLALARALLPQWRQAAEVRAGEDHTGFSALAMGRRKLRLVALEYLLTAGEDADIEMAWQAYTARPNMTLQANLLRLLVHRVPTDAEAASSAFEARWRDDPLVLDKWFSVHATRPGEGALEAVERMRRHSGYDPLNPNRVRAVVNAYARLNPTGFHRTDGAGYRLLADEVLRLDGENPQLAARLAAAFAPWRRFAEPWQGEMRQRLEGLLAATRSRDVREQVGKMLAD